MKWEYKMCAPPSLSEFGMLGNDGWELIHVYEKVQWEGAGFPETIFGMNGGGPAHLFKRQKD